MSAHAHQRLIDALERHGSTGRGTAWQCPAPGHDDRVASMAVTDKADRVLIHCHGGCESTDILDALGLEFSDLYDERATSKGWSNAALRKTGATANGDGRVTLGAVRYKPGAGENETKALAVKGSKRDLWPDPATVTGNVLYLVEGEPDAVTAATLGLPAVGVPGAGKWEPGWAARIAAGRERVVIVVDADEPGRKAGQKWAADIAAHCPDVRIVDLASSRDDGSDLSDWVASSVTAEHFAKDREVIEAMAEAAEPVARPPSNVAPLRPVPDTRDSRNIRNIRNIGSLLRQIRRHMSRYVVLPGADEEVALALFVAHTWAFDGAHATPYIVIQSPEKQSGKTRVLEVIGVLVREPLQVASASEAALFRQIEQVRCTLLLDEIDATFAQHSERTEALRGLINSGNRASGSAIRCVGPQSEPKVFSTFCPKVLAGIDEGRLPDTILDRAIEIRMKRKLPGERVDRFRDRTARQDVAPLLEGLAAWAAGAADGLLDAEPVVPDELDDRAAEAWEPLFAIADSAGGEWPALARDAAKRLSGQRDDDDTGSVGRRLLAAVKLAWPPGDGDRMASVDLCHRLNNEEDLPYGGWSDGKGINAGSLARYLKPYGIASASLRITGPTTLKGYRRDDFEEAWQRYLPANVPDVPDVPANTNGSVEGSGGVA